MLHRKGKWFDEPKFIVTEGKLKQLMRRCVACGGEAVGQQVQQQGSYGQFTISCTETLCRHEESWETSDSYDQKFVINILLAAAILFSGGIATKVLRMFNFINIQVPSPRSFFRHQSDYLHGVS